MKRKKMAEKSLTVQEAYDQFQRSNLTKGLSEGTIRYYESYSRAFFKFLGDTTQPLTEVTKDTVDDYTLYLKGKDTVTDTTVNTALRMVRAFLYFCMERDWIPHFTISQIKAVQPVKEPYTNDELAKLLKSAAKLCKGGAVPMTGLRSFLYFLLRADFMQLMLLSTLLFLLPLNKGTSEKQDILRIDK